jgi:DNA helicase-2/ATP-dependent DNA helicase PcrA
MDERIAQWLAELNPQQRDAVTHGDGPLLVVAGAGTGKTKTLACRVSYLLSQGVAPERILLLTFTRRAAEEMLKRASSVSTLDYAITRRVWGGTFHSVANRLLHMYASAIDVSPDFTILDRSDAEDLLNVVRNDLGFSTNEKRFPLKKTCLEMYSRRVNGNDTLEQVLKEHFPRYAMWQNELKTLFREYVTRKQNRNVLDYDDLLLYWYSLLQEESLAKAIGGRFDHILVDEYQDTNAIQAGILQGMRAQSTSITAVGDDAQSIYSFRSATVRNMLDFPARFPGAKIVTLEQNYRSVGPILQTTNRLIAQSHERYAKDLWTARDGGQKPQLITCADEDDQDRAVIDRVLEHRERGTPLHKQAVLFRAASHSGSLELALTKRNIPFHKYGGLRFLEMAHIKDLICFLRIAENSRDEVAWFRVLQLLDGVGPVTAAAAFQHLADDGYRPSSLLTSRAPAASREGMAGLSYLVDGLAKAEESPSAQIEQIHQFYRPILERTYDDPRPRSNDIEHLAQLARRCQTRREFLSELVLDPPVSTGDLAGPPTKDEDWLVLSTIHSAKGLEWDAVYLIHASDGNLPSDMSTGTDEEVDEELRLTYVAMTRARDFLYVVWPLRYYNKSAGISDKHSYAQCSRFFTREVVATMDSVVSEGATERKEVPANIPHASVRERIARFWD